ncbi:MerR family transcriptional regulator [Lentzea flava]|uniref:MerR family transcriptional regulator n=1 Tax=Lentzea flava TaxID=103732 RepID=A0ABQ2UJI0_9PSEU|nr:MerR family transcriptional regulator [Lentzea flava]MCP2199829.1 DNA-binding transcriptional regulator, MerR family [Lentzea flava]GGU40526.1 MerR family transcriptional regulator [Lentzea flava]
MTRWSIGDLAKASGLTVRTLHHYDEIGLVVASERTTSGHRRYTPEDVRRLYQVRSLRQLGLSLDEVRTALSRSDSLRPIFSAQLAALTAQAQRLEALRSRLTALLEGHTTESLLSTLEMMSVYESYFTADQLEDLRSRAAAMGPEAVEALKASWLELVKQLRQHMADGTPPSDPRVVELARQWDELGAEFTGGDPAIQAAAQRSWEENKAAISTQIGWPAEDGLVDYVSQARAAR